MKACWIWFGGTFSVVLVTAMLVGCGGAAPTASISADDPSGEVSKVDPAAGGAATLTASASNGETQTPAPRKDLFPEVVIKTSAGDVRVRLNAEKAPLTVDNFLEDYVDRGFYNNKSEAKRS